MPNQPCPLYDKCTFRMGEDDRFMCTPEGFITVEDGILCLAWDVVLPITE